MIPLPIASDAPRPRRATMTMALIAVNAVAWAYELAHGVGLATLDYGLIPAWLVRGVRDGPITIPGFGAAILHQEVPYPWTVLTAMFMHGGWLHVIGNMWFLWIFGQAVEGAMGSVPFLAFYLLAGLAAALGQVLFTPSSMAPMVGASGAIAGVLGGYLLLYPRTRVRSVWVLVVFVTSVNVPAWLLLGLWFVSQFFVPMEAGVAWVAHVAGFAAGIAMVGLFAARARATRPGPPAISFP